MPIENNIRIYNSYISPLHIILKTAPMHHMVLTPRNAIILGHCCSGGTTKLSDYDFKILTEDGMREMDMVKTSETYGYISYIPQDRITEMSWRRETI